MEVIQAPLKMQQRAEGWRRKGKVIAFVPTMGYFHEGHLSLMREGRRKGDILVVSIFVNPTQFAPGEDFERYPRDMERDLKMAEGVGADVVFAPEREDMYPPGFQTFVEVQEVTQHLCGLFRPGHFRGVTTVVAKLFNIVKPHIALFGQKDYQQLVTIRRMVKDLNMDVEIVGMPTVREEDGLAASSRNIYLSPQERERALSLYRSLLWAQEAFSRGERSGRRLMEGVREILQREGIREIDYVKVCDLETLEDIEGEIEGGALVALAAKVGKARLIDNIILKEGEVGKDHA